MELTQTLDVTAEEFFDQIERSIVSDIRHATGEEVPRERLSGFSYEKRARGGGRGGTPMKVRIAAYRYPESYRVRFAYARGTTEISYEARRLSAGSIELIYREEFTAVGSMRGFNRRLGLLLYERRVRARAGKTIRGIVSYILRAREGEGPRGDGGAAVGGKGAS